MKLISCAKQGCTNSVVLDSPDTYCPDHYFVDDEEVARLRAQVQTARKYALEEAVTVVRSWRELTVQAFYAAPCVDPREAARECRNALNLLGTIESELRRKAGHDPKVIFREAIERGKREGVEYP